MDVSSPIEWERALPRIEGAIGAPRGAVLLAGGWQGGHSFHQEDEAVWQKMFALNLETARHSLRALLPGMVQRRAGSIVAMGSQVVERPWKGARAAAYVASKSAVVALARVVAAEVAADKVRVNAVLPSTIDTAANRAAMPSSDRKGWVSPDSLAQAIGFLLSDASGDIFGAALPIYGGA
jgi:NAD(P)-dependent dehydrogenase (short-subunit alcohol dehydrogenase family)